MKFFGFKKFQPKTSFLSAMASSCSICCSVMASSAVLTCIRCEYKSCKECLSKWMETKAGCPNPDCALPFTRELLTEQMPKLVPSFTLKEKADLFEAEKALLPDTLQYVESYREYKKLKEEEKDLFDRKKQINDELLTINQKVNHIKRLDYYAKESDFEGLERMLKFVPEQHHHYDRYHDDEEDRNGDDKIKRARKDPLMVLCPCPLDTCKGFVTYKQGQDEAIAKCPVCDTQVCIECLCKIPLQKEGDASHHAKHQCLPDDLASAKMIKKGSKPCPKCGTRISKVDGCDQMWCVACRTPFSWNTGKVETGPIHNPEYFRMRRELREKGLLQDDQDLPPAREEGVIPCPENQVFLEDPGRNMRYNGLLYRLEQNYGSHFVHGLVELTNEYSKAQSFCLGITRFMYHFGLYTRIQTNPERPDNKDLRMKYINGEITEKEFQSKIMQRQKRVQNLSDVKDVHDLFWETGNVLLQRLYQNVNDNYLTTILEVQEQMLNLIAMCNERLKKIGKVYSVKSHLILIKDDGDIEYV